jgi:hypothetical protein
VPGKNPAEFCSFMGGKTSDQGADVWPVRYLYLTCALVYGSQFETTMNMYNLHIWNITIYLFCWDRCVYLTNIKCCLSQERPKDLP